LERFWKAHPAIAWVCSAAWVVLIGGIIFVWKLGSVGLVDETEPLFVEAARQMTITGDWITPYFNDETRFDKPPLIYWLMAIADQIIGVNEWSARLPSALAAIALMGLALYTLKRFATPLDASRPSPNFSWLAAWIGSAAIALTPLMWAWGRTGVSDMLLTGCIGLALLTFFCGYAVGEDRHQPSDNPSSSKPQPSSSELQSSTSELQPSSSELQSLTSDLQTLSSELQPSSSELQSLTSDLQTLSSELQPSSSELQASTVEPEPSPSDLQASSSDRQASRSISPLPWYFACYLFTGLAVLTKGPVGIVLPGLIIAAFLLYVGRFWQVWREMRPILGGLLMLAIALPWYILVILANGNAFIDAFFGYHNLQRFTSVVNHHWAPWYFYVVVVVLGFAPWSIFLPLAIARLQVWKRSIWRHQPRSSHLGVFALFWFAGVFLFFTIAVTKLPSYVVPLMPAAAILMGLFWSGQLTQAEAVQQRRWGMTLSGLCTILIWVAIAVAILYAPYGLENDSSQPLLPQLLRQSGVITGGVAIALTSAVMGGILLLRRQIGWLWLVNLVACLTLFCFICLPTLSIVDSQRQLPLRQLAETANHVRQPGEELVMAGFKMPSIVFYTRQHVTFSGSADQTTQYLQDIVKRPKKPASLLLLGDPKLFAAIGLRPKQYQPLQQNPPYQLIRLRIQDDLQPFSQP
jgi:4-amino-4-deoxy-L-arabinose transferase-like glycosyltransferase